MANRVHLEVIQKSDSSVWATIVHCDGTKDDYIQIPCPCPTPDPGGGSDNPPVYPSSERCTMANGYMIAYLILAAEFQAKAIAQPDNVFGNAVAASQQAAQTFLYPAYYAIFNGFLSAYGTPFEAIAITVPPPGIGPNVPNPDLIQELVCLCYAALTVSGDTFDQVWFDTMTAQLASHDAYAGISAAEWDILAALHYAVLLNYWQWYAPQLALDPAGFVFLSCDDCTAGGGNCEPISVTWLNTGETPASWSSLSIVNTSGWAGDISDLAAPTYAITRNPNADWRKPTSEGDDIYSTRGGIKYVYSEPCEIRHVKFTMNAGTGNSKRMAVAVKLENDSMKVIYNYVNPMPTPADMTADFTLEIPVVVKEVWFLTITGDRGSATRYLSINQVTVIS